MVTRVTKRAQNEEFPGSQEDSGSAVVLIKVDMHKDLIRKPLYSPCPRNLLYSYTEKSMKVRFSPSFVD